MRKNYLITMSVLIIFIISVALSYGEEESRGDDLYEELAKQAERISAVKNPDKVISLLEPYKNNPENKSSLFFNNLALAYKVKKIMMNQLEIIR